MKALSLSRVRVNTQMCSVHGFTLLEVMVALAIIAIAFTAMLSSQAHNVTLAAETKFQTTAPMLAQDILTRYKNEKLTNSGTEQGDWGHDFPDYRWQVQAVPVAVALGSGPLDLVRVEVTVSWHDQKRYTYRHRGYIFNASSAQ